MKPDARSFYLHETKYNEFLSLWDKNQRVLSLTGPGRSRFSNNEETRAHEFISTWVQNERVSGYLWRDPTKLYRYEIQRASSYMRPDPTSSSGMTRKNEFLAVLDQSQRVSIYTRPDQTSFYVGLYESRSNEFVATGSQIQRDSGCLSPVRPDAASGLTGHREILSMWDQTQRVPSYVGFSFNEVLDKRGQIERISI